MSFTKSRGSLDPRSWKVCYEPYDEDSKVLVEKTHQCMLFLDLRMLGRAEKGKNLESSALIRQQFDIAVSGARSPALSLEK